MKKWKTQKDSTVKCLHEQMDGSMLDLVRMRLLRHDKHSPRLKTATVGAENGLPYIEVDAREVFEPKILKGVVPIGTFKDAIMI